MTPFLRQAPHASVARARAMPTTRLGRLACRLGLAFLAWFVVNQSFIGMRDTLAGIPVLPFIVFGFVGLGLGLSAGIAGLLAVARHGERGWLVYLAMLPGAFVIVFLAGELLVPH